MKHRFALIRKVALIIALITVLAGFSPAAPAYGQSNGLQITADAAYDGYFKYGEWLPVWVQVENSGADTEAELQVRVAGSGQNYVFVAPVSLPAGARKRVPVYVLPNNFTHALEVQLVVDGRVVTSQPVTTRGLPNINYLIGIIAPNRDALSLIVGTKLMGQDRTKVLVDLALSELPERVEGLFSFDLLIINDTDTSSLTPDQKNALTNWVNEGGRLIIGGGANARSTVSGLPPELVPLTPTNEIEVDVLSALEQYAGEGLLVSGPFVVATGSNVDGETLASQDNLPLIVEKSLGNGYIDYVALSLTGTPFNAWAGTTAFWERLISPGSAYPDWIPPDMSVRQILSNGMAYPLSNLPSLDLPSIRWLAILLSAYIVLVGPVNYLILRWRKRLQWAWITIPVLTVVFATVAFSLGYLMRGNDLIINKISIIQSLPGGDGRVMNYYGLFSPAQTSYEVEVGDRGLISPLTAYYDPWTSGAMPVASQVYFVQGDTSALRGLSVSQWSMQTFMTEGKWEGMGEVRGTFEMTGSALQGEIINDTAQTVHNAVIVLGTQVKHLGDLEPGETYPVSISIPDLISPNYGPSLSYIIFQEEYNKPMPNGPSRELQLKSSILDNLFMWGGVNGPALSSRSVARSSGLPQLMVLGWLDNIPSNVLVSGREPSQMSTGLVLAQLEYTFPTQGEIVLPPGLLPGLMIESPIEGWMCGSGNPPSVYLVRGEAVFEFRVSEEFDDLNLQELQIAVRIDGGWNQSLPVEVYDWDQEAWREIQNAVLGVNTISQPGSLISPEGQVQVRLTADQTIGSWCYFIGVGLKGTR